MVRASHTATYSHHPTTPTPNQRHPHTSNHLPTLDDLLRQPSHAASAASTASRASAACMAGTRAKVTWVAGSVYIYMCICT